MKFQRVLLFALSGIPLFFCACSDTDTDLIEPSLVQEELQIYFDRFVFEAQLRGIHIDYNATPITAKITGIDPPEVAGTCLRKHHDINEIEISQSYWNATTDLQREYVLFHELGHCYLNRGHRESTTAQGICLSIMASGTGDCRPNYNRSTRAFYLNELFTD